MKISQLDLSEVLTKSELRVWNILVSNNGVPIHPAALYCKSQGFESFDLTSEANSCINLISRIRKKVPEGCIVSVRNQGYVFQDGEVEEGDVK